METGMYIPRPDESVYLAREHDGAALGQRTTTFLLDRIEYPESGGMQAWLRGVPFPRKGFPTPEALRAVNLSKRLLVVLARRTPPWALCAPRRAFLGLMADWVDASWATVLPFLHTEGRTLPGALAARGMSHAFLRSLGADEGLADKASKLLSAIPDYDDAYRLRLGDMCSETSADALIGKPSGETLRLIRLYMARERAGRVRANAAMGWVIPLALLLPSFRRAFRIALNRPGFGKMANDEADRYWAALRDDYDFGGMTHAERMVGREMPAAYEVTV